MNASTKHSVFLCVLLSLALTATFGVLAQNSGDVDKKVNEYIERIRSYKDRVQTLSVNDYGDVLSFLELTRLITSTSGGIDYFRALDDLDIVETLVDMTNIDDRGIRINASLILANVVDNTTVCGVIDRLLGGALNDNARYNLLQVVKVVAGYAREENRAWIRSMLDSQAVSTDGDKYSRTLLLLKEIAQVLETSHPVDDMSFAEKYPSDYATCVALPRIAELGNPVPASHEATAPEGQ